MNPIEQLAWQTEVDEAKTAIIDYLKTNGPSTPSCVMYYLGERPFSYRVIQAAIAQMYEDGEIGRNTKWEMTL